MKRWFAFLLAALLLMFAGCAHSQTDQNASESADSQGEAGLSFDTVTVFGDPISTENLHEYDLVIVNCWAEWCGPCVGEMPELERIHQEYPNVLLIGMLSFSDNVDGAKATISDTGVTYPVILPAGTLMKLLERFDAIPSTVFYDNTGEEIAEPVIGSRSYEEWKAIIEDLLP